MTTSHCVTDEQSSCRSSHLPKLYICRQVSFHSLIPGIFAANKVAGLCIGTPRYIRFSTDNLAADERCFRGGRRHRPILLRDQIQLLVMTQLHSKNARALRWRPTRRQARWWGRREGGGSVCDRQLLPFPSLLPVPSPPWVLNFIFFFGGRMQ